MRKCPATCPQFSNAKVLLLLPWMLWSYQRLMALFTARPISSGGEGACSEKKEKPSKRKGFGGGRVSSLTLC